MKWLSSARRLPIGLPEWQRLVEQLHFLQGFDAATTERFRALVAEFLTAKAISGAAGLEVDDTMRLSVAAQACLPVLQHSLSWYDDFSEVIIYPAAFAVRRSVTDEVGVVHEFEDLLAGEAMEGGPVVLSWHDVAGHPDEVLASNVVIHEFAHKLDMANGGADGCPPMPAHLRRRWSTVLRRSYERFVVEVDELERSIPPDVDPESAQADDWYRRLSLDPYAATDPAEFFAVAAEAFFIDPWLLASSFPEFYDCMRDYFAMDPRQRLSG